jgi:hypothetical protein
MRCPGIRTGRRTGVARRSILPGGEDALRFDGVKTEPYGGRAEPAALTPSALRARGFRAGWVRLIGLTQLPHPARADESARCTALRSVIVSLVYTCVVSIEACPSISCRCRIGARSGSRARYPRPPNAGVRFPPGGSHSNTTLRGSPDHGSLEPSADRVAPGCVELPLRPGSPSGVVGASWDLGCAWRGRTPTNPVPPSSGRRPADGLTARSGCARSTGCPCPSHARRALPSVLACCTGRHTFFITGFYQATLPGSGPMGYREVFCASE